VTDYQRHADRKNKTITNVQENRKKGLDNAINAMLDAGQEKKRQTDKTPPIYNGDNSVEKERRERLTPVKHVLCFTYVSCRIFLTYVIRALSNSRQIIF
jgi:hypothetical protein